MLYIRLQPFFFQVQLYKIEINMESTRKTTYQKKKRVLEKHMGESIF